MGDHRSLEEREDEAVDLRRFQSGAKPGTHRRGEKAVSANPVSVEMGRGWGVWGEGRGPRPPFGRPPAESSVAEWGGTTSTSG